MEYTVGAIVVINSEPGTIGLLVDKLDAVPSFKKPQVQPVGKLLHGDSYVKALTNIPESNMIGKMLIVLNQGLILAVPERQ